jgi:hypothetical protein
MLMGVCDPTICYLLSEKDSSALMGINDSWIKRAGEFPTSSSLVFTLA